jgi:NIMA (never in mitosis gene a)-related kinase
VLVQDREGKLYVMKIIDMSRMDQKQRKDAINEVKVLSSLKHPYIVSYRESFAENRNLAIVMDYADGGDLHQRIQRMRHAGQTFPETKVLRWFTEAALALKYLHDKHVLHRDLKSQNLFLTSQDRLRIGDFGISKVLESTVAFARTTIGTPYYLSPEICLEKPYDWKSDIWALGCVLYEICALRVPFDAQSLQELVRKITRGPTPTLPGTWSTELRQLCGDLLHRDQSQRPSAPEILGRSLIQREIRVMLREEQSKSESARPNPAAQAQQGESEAQVMRRKGSLRKTPSVDGEDGVDSARYRHAPLKGVGGAIGGVDVGGRVRDPSPKLESYRGGVPRAPHMEARDPSPNLQGLPRVPYMEGQHGFDRGNWQAVPAGGHSRHHTPSGHRR